MRLSRNGGSQRVQSDANPVAEISLHAYAKEYEKAVFDSSGILARLPLAIAGAGGNRRAAR